MSTCEYPKCESEAVHTHHITYQPEATVRLCRKHHEDITIINGAQARKRSGWTWRYQSYHKLTNYERKEIWYGFIHGYIKPRRTKKALARLKSWDQYDKSTDSTPATKPDTSLYPIPAPLLK